MSHEKAAKELPALATSTARTRRDRHDPELSNPLGVQTNNKREPMKKLLCYGHFPIAHRRKFLPGSVYSATYPRFEASESATDEPLDDRL